MSNKTTSALVNRDACLTFSLICGYNFKRPLQLYKEQDIQVGAEYSYFDLDLDFLIMRVI